MCGARRPQPGGGVGRTSGRPALSRGARVFPRGAPGVAATSGRSGGWRCPGCARHPGTSQGGVNPEVRPKKKKCSVFMIFGLFWLTFACCVSDFAVFGSVFQKKIPRWGHLGLPLGARCPRCVPTSGDRACRRARGDPHLGHDASWRSRGAPHHPSLITLDCVLAK